MGIKFTLIMDKLCTGMLFTIICNNELRGGGVHPDYFVKLDFEIAVDQQTRARDRTFEGVLNSG